MCRASAYICNRYKYKYSKSGEDKISSACQQGCLRRLTQLERPGCIKLIDSRSLGHPDGVLSGSFWLENFWAGSRGQRCDLVARIIAASWCQVRSEATFDLEGHNRHVHSRQVAFLLSADGSEVSRRSAQRPR